MMEELQLEGTECHPGVQIMTCGRGTSAAWWQAEWAWWAGSVSWCAGIGPSLPLLAHIRRFLSYHTSIPHPHASSHWELPHFLSVPGS